MQAEGFDAFQKRISQVTAKTIYKIVARDTWREAEAAGTFKGATIDLSDGYIHFSTAAQARQTAALHFKDQRDLLLVAVSTTTLGDRLQWEPSRGGDLFPHVYGDLSMEAVSTVDELPLDDNGVHVFPALDEL